MSNTIFTPNVSIVLPTYNRAHLLEKSIKSVLAQSYQNFELIIVDDGSTDNTKELVENIDDSRIKYFYTKINSGASAARNFGIQKASCDFIAFHDSDDFMRKNKLQKLMDLITQNPQYGFVYHKISYDIGDNKSFVLPNEKIELSKKSGDIFAQLLIDNLVDCPSLLVRKECLDDVGLFDESLKALEDYDMALKLAYNYQAGFVNEILLDSTYSTTGVSGNAINYLNSSCMLIYKYKKEYISTGTLNHRLEIILRDAEAVGAKDEYVKLLEKIMIS